MHTRRARVCACVCVSRNRVARCQSITARTDRNGNSSLWPPESGQAILTPLTMPSPYGVAPRDFAQICELDYGKGHRVTFPARDTIPPPSSGKLSYRNVNSFATLLVNLVDASFDTPAAPRSRSHSSVLRDSLYCNESFITLNRKAIHLVSDSRIKCRSIRSQSSTAELSLIPLDLINFLCIEQPRSPRSVYLTNASITTGIQDLVDGDVFALEVAGLPSSCNRTVTIRTKKKRHTRVGALRTLDIDIISRRDMPASAIESLQSQCSIPIDRPSYIC